MSQPIQAIRRPDLDNKDHIFSKFLRESRWSGKTRKTRKTTTYFSKNGDAICAVFYDNEKCEYRVHEFADI